GEQGRLRSRRRHELRRKSEGTFDDLLRHSGQQRPPEQLDAAHPGAAEGGQELRVAGRPRRGTLRHPAGPDDGVLHRESGVKWREAVTDLNRNSRRWRIQMLRSLTLPVPYRLPSRTVICAFCVPAASRLPNLTSLA